MKNYGFKNALFAMAAMLFFISVLPQLIWYRNYPADKNQQMDNGYVPSSENVVSAKNKLRYFSPVDWETKDALKTPQIWMVVIAWSCLVFSYIAIMYFSITLFVMNGMDTVRASTILGSINFIGMITALIAGRIIDKIGPKITLVAVCLCSVAGSLLILVVSDVATGWIFALVFGFSVGALVPCVASIIPSYYGVKNYPHIQGSVQWILALSSGVAATGIGIILTKTGSLVPAFWVSAGVSGIALLIVIALRPPLLLEKHKDCLENQEVEDAK